MKLLQSFLAVCLLLLMAIGAEAQLTRGSLAGTVRDETGGVLPGVAVTITNQATGIARTVVTNESGLYRAPALEPGQYLVTAELSGFRKVQTKDVRIQPAIEGTYHVQLQVAPAGEEIVVEGSTSGVELNKSNPTVGLVVTERQVTDLPLSPARNVNNLALLSPNVAQGPGSSGISANGNRARNNNFMIDGTDNNDASVTIATTPVLPEEVAEFQIQTNAFDAEFGRNTGAQINVITRSGTNAFKGEVWDFYRSSGLDTLNNLQKAAGLSDAPKDIRHQAGASFGGPLIKNRTFFFGLYQRASQRTGDILGATVRIPTAAGFAALANVPLRAGQSTASRQAVLASLNFLRDIHAGNPTYRSINNLLVNGVPIESGQVNIGRRTPSTTHHATIRIDHQLGAKDSLTLRWTGNFLETLNNGGNNALGAIFAASTDAKDHNASVSHTHVFGSTTVNEFRASLVRRDLRFPENDPLSPTATIAGLFTVGGLANFPQGRLQNSLQFVNVTSLQRGRHSIRFGADVRYGQLDNEAAFNSKGNFAFASLQNFMNNLSTTYQVALQTASYDARQWQIYPFVQDDFRITPQLTLNLGLRYELSTVPFGFFGAFDAESRAALVPGPVKKDTNNISPRIGFAWSPSRGSGIFGDGKSVLRGGYGVAYDVLFFNLLTVNASNYPRVVTTTDTNLFDRFPTVTRGSGAPVFDPLAGYVNAAEDTQNPKTHFYNLTLQREAGTFVFEVGYNGSTGRNGINQISANPGILTREQAATVASTRNQTSIPNLQQRRLFPQFGGRTLIPATLGPGGNDVEAKSQFHGAFVSVRKRMNRGLQFGLSYTLSRLESNNDEALGVGGIVEAAPQVPQDHFDISSEWGLSVFDRTHRVAFNWIWEIPGPKDGIVGRVFGGWQLAGTFSGQSGQPFTVLTGVDTNGNGLGGDRPNVDPSGSFLWDEEHKTFTNNGYYVVPRANDGSVLPFSLGNGNGLKTAHRAAASFNTDLSLSKTVTFGRHRVSLRVDAFNLFDQDDYGLPVTNMASPDFGRNTNNWGNRTISLGARYRF